MKFKLSKVSEFITIPHENDVRLYLHLFVGGRMSYLRYLCLSLPPLVCRRAHVMSYLRYLCLFLPPLVGGGMSYLRYLCLFLPPLVCRRGHVLFTLFEEGACLIYVICVCFYLHLFVGGGMSYLRLFVFTSTCL